MKCLEMISHSRPRFHPSSRAIPALLLVGMLLFLLLAAESAQGKEERGEHRLGNERVEAIADRIIKPAMNEKQLPSLVLGVVKNGQVVVNKGYGVRSFESGRTPDENTVYYIGSLSKAITAVGIMLLVEQGKVNLDTPASNYLRGLPRIWQPITVAQFMAHQSGIPQLDKKLPTFRAMLRSADATPLSFAPETKQEYNNFNFAVAGKIIEAVTGMNYLNYMRRAVFNPLGMNHTGLNIVSRDSAIGYRPSRFGPQPIQHRIAARYGIPSGHLQSTLSDLLKFYHAIQTGKLLKPATYEQMVTRINPNLSGTPGWFEKKTGHDSIVSKNGATQGSHSIMTFVSGKGDAVVMLWTSQKPKRNGLFKATNELLREICGVGVHDQAEPTDDPQD